MEESSITESVNTASISVKLRAGAGDMSLQCGLFITSPCRSISKVQLSALVSAICKVTITERDCEARMTSTENYQKGIACGTSVVGTHMKITHK